MISRNKQCSVLSETGELCRGDRFKSCNVFLDSDSDSVSDTSSGYSSFDEDVFADLIVGDSLREGDVIVDSSDENWSEDVSFWVLDNIYPYNEPLPQRIHCQVESLGKEWEVDESFYCVTSSDQDINVDTSYVYDPLPQRSHSVVRCTPEKVWPDDVDNFWEVVDDHDNICSCKLCVKTSEMHKFKQANVQMHTAVQESGLPNYLGCKYKVASALNMPEWKNRLHCFRDQDVVKFLEFGWPIGVEGEVKSKQEVRNHGGARQFPSSVEKFIVSEVQAGHVLGPFLNKPFNGAMNLSPLNTVPKKESSERRIILDLSHPRGESVNDHIPKDTYLGVSQKIHLPSVDNLVRLVRVYGPGCLIFKRDLHKAYRQIPVDPGDVHLLGYSWRGHYFCDRVLPMGMRSACQACQRMTNGVSYAMSQMGYNCVNYIDDLAGAGGLEGAWSAYYALQDLLLSLGLVESLDKAQPPSTSMVFLGILFNTVSGTLEIPVDKMVEIEQVLAIWEGKEYASRKEVQSLIGKLQFAAACIRPGRIFISRMLNFLRGMPDVGVRKIPGTFLKDVYWWQCFMPVYNGISMMPLTDWLNPDAIFSSDACLEGCGGWYEGKYFHTTFPSFILRQNLHINALELLTVVICLKLWGTEFQGLRIKIHCDNEASVTVLNTGRSRDPFLQACLREISFLAAKFRFELKAVHLPGALNRLPDLLSRWGSASCRKEFSARTAGLHMKCCHVDAQCFRFSHKW